MRGLFTVQYNLMNSTDFSKVMLFKRVQPFCRITHFLKAQYIRLFAKLSDLLTEQILISKCDCHVFR